MPDNDTFIELAAYPNEMEAQMTAQLLRENGVGAYVQPVGYGYTIYGVTPFIPHRVMIYQPNLQRAQAILGDGEWDEAK